MPIDRNVDCLICTFVGVIVMREIAVVTWSCSFTVRLISAVALAVTISSVAVVRVLRQSLRITHDCWWSFSQADDELQTLQLAVASPPPTSSSPV